MQDLAAGRVESSLLPTGIQPAPPQKPPQQPSPGLNSNSASTVTASVDSTPLLPQTQHASPPSANSGLGFSPPQPGQSPIRRYLVTQPVARLLLSLTFLNRAIVAVIGTGSSYSVQLDLAGWYGVAFDGVRCSCRSHTMTCWEPALCSCTTGAYCRPHQ
jgi:hypothetical protein